MSALVRHNTHRAHADNQLAGSLGNGQLGIDKTKRMIIIDKYISRADNKSAPSGQMYVHILVYTTKCMMDGIVRMLESVNLVSSCSNLPFDENMYIAHRMIGP